VTTSSDSNRGARIVIGGLISNIVGWLVCAIYVGLYLMVSRAGSHFGTEVLMYSTFPNLILVPMTMGVAAAYVWRPLDLRIGVCFLLSLLFTMTSLGGAYFILKEGVICLVMASPLLLAAFFGGVALGRRWFRAHANTLRLSILPLLLVVVLAEPHVRTQREEVVIDQIVIRATASEVWKHVMRFPEIQRPPNHWLNYLGLPAASATTCEGEFVGANRRCIFSNGVALEERVAELVPEHLLTFDVVEQPRDPELLGHLTLHRGQFELQENGDGTTTLTGRSWYTLHIHPHWYFDWWTRDITSHVHVRVMEHIKQLSEADRD
jgi:hypothetical protein